MDEVVDGGTDQTLQRHPEHGSDLFIGEENQAFHCKSEGAFRHLLDHHAVSFVSPFERVNPVPVRT